MEGIQCVKTFLIHALHTLEILNRLLCDGMKIARGSHKAASTQHKKNLQTQLYISG